MKLKSFVTVLLVSLVLVSCAPVATIVPTETSIPGATITPVPPTPTITPSPMPTIEIEGLIIPDPRFSNPELLDLENINAPIPQFVYAMNLAGVEITPSAINDGLIYKLVRTHQGDVAILMVTTDEQATTYDESNFPLLVYSYYKGEQEWKAATIANMGAIANKHTGSQVVWWKLDDKQYVDTLKQVADYVVIDGELNTQVLLPNGKDILLIEKIQQNQDLSEIDNMFDWVAADKIVRFANQNGLKVQGHHLFVNWYMTDEVINGLKSGQISYDDYEKFLQVYTQTIVRHYSQDGLTIDEWTINEIPLALEWGDPDKILSRLVYDRRIITKLAGWAKEVNPDIRIIFNENNILDIDSERQQYIKVLKMALADGAQIDEIGLQNHIWVYKFPSEIGLQKALAELEILGLPISSTEATVSISDRNFFIDNDEKIKSIPPESLDFARAEIYAQLFKYIDRNAVFGFTDAVSMFELEGDPTAKAMIFDNQFRPKLDVYKIMKAMLELLQEEF